MLRTDHNFAEAVERAVRDAERRTRAEIVVVAAARSGSYLDLALIAGGAFGLLTLALALFSPLLVSPLLLAIELPLVVAVAAWGVNRTPGLLRRLIRRERAQKQVARAAAWHFVHEAVHGTRGRTGILVYVSILEERVTVVPDLGVAATAPQALLNGLPWGPIQDAARVRSTSDLVRGLVAMGELLRERLPGDAADANEMPDAPRIVE